jgi:nicotinamidase-related amidase
MGWQSSLSGGSPRPNQLGIPMTSPQTIRDPYQDRLLTPKNSALVIIDFQPVQVGSIASMDRRMLVANVVALAKSAKLFGLPVVLSTVNVETGINKPLIPELQDVFPDNRPIDRTTVNAWEDTDFLAAVKRTERKKLIMAALWTEVCLTFPTLDALSEGFEIYPVVDAVGGTSLVAHEAALQRIVQAGARLTSWVQVICELQRDWNRKDTAGTFSQILFGVDETKKL